MDSKEKIVLDPSKQYIFPIKDGYLDIAVKADSDYPGLDIEYVSSKEDDNQPVTRPRVLIENNQGALRAAVWGNPYSEDYSSSTTFTCAEDICDKGYDEDLDDRR